MKEAVEGADRGAERATPRSIVATLRGTVGRHVGGQRDVDKRDHRADRKIKPADQNNKVSPMAASASGALPEASTCRSK